MLSGRVSHAQSIQSRQSSLACSYACPSAFSSPSHASLLHACCNCGPHSPIESAGHRGHWQPARIVHTPSAWVSLRSAWCVGIPHEHDSPWNQEPFVAVPSDSRSSCPPRFCDANTTDDETATITSNCQHHGSQPPAHVASCDSHDIASLAFCLLPI